MQASPNRAVSRPGSTPSSPVVAKSTRHPDKSIPKDMNTNPNSDVTTHHSSTVDSGASEKSQTRHPDTYKSHTSTLASSGVTHIKVPIMVNNGHPDTYRTANPFADPGANPPTGWAVKAEYRPYTVLKKEDTQSNNHNPDANPREVYIARVNGMYTWILILLTVCLPCTLSMFVWLICIGDMHRVYYHFSFSLCVIYLSFDPSVNLSTIICLFIYLYI